MARLRFPGRPGQRFGRNHVRYISDDLMIQLEPSCKVSYNIERGLKFFYTLFGCSDEEEDFEGFCKEEISETEAVLAAKLSCVSSDHEQWSSSESKAVSTPLQHKRGMRDLLRKSYNKMIKDGLCKPFIQAHLTKTKSHKFLSNIKNSAENIFVENTSLTVRNHTKVLENITSSVGNKAKHFLNSYNSQKQNFSGSKINNPAECDNMQSIIVMNDNYVEHTIAQRLLKKAKRGRLKNIQEKQIGRNVKKKMAKQYNYPPKKLKSLKKASKRTGRPGRPRIVAKFTHRDMCIHDRSSPSLSKECKVEVPVMKNNTVSSRLKKRSMLVGKQKFIVPNVSTRSSGKTFSKKRYVDEIDSHELSCKKKIISNDNSNINTLSVHSSLNHSAEVSNNLSSITVLKGRCNLQKRIGLLDQPLVVQGKRPWKPSLKVQMKLSEMNCELPYGMKMCDEEGSGTVTSGSDVIKPDMVSKYAEKMAQKPKEKLQKVDVKKNGQSVTNSPTSPNVANCDISDADDKKSDEKLEKVAARIEKMLKSQWEGRLNQSSEKPQSEPKTEVKRSPQSKISPLSMWKNELQQKASNQRRTKSIIRKARLQLKKRTLKKLRQPQSVAALTEQLQKPDCSTVGASLILENANLTSSSVVKQHELPLEQKEKENTAHENLNQSVDLCCICGCGNDDSETKIYYGQLSCEPCSKFFQTFVDTPRQYFCSKNGDCDTQNASIKEIRSSRIINRFRCKACWLKVCMEKFVVTSLDRVALLNYVPRLESPPHLPLIKDEIALPENVITFTDLARNIDAPSESKIITNSKSEIPVITESENVSNENCEALVPAEAITAVSNDQKDSSVEKTLISSAVNASEKNDCVINLKRSRRIRKPSRYVLGDEYSLKQKHKLEINNSTEAKTFENELNNKNKVDELGEFKTKKNISSAKDKKDDISIPKAEKKLLVSSNNMSCESKDTKTINNKENNATTAMKKKLRNRSVASKIKSEQPVQQSEKVSGEVLDSSALEPVKTAEDGVSQKDGVKVKGPRIKHVCRRAAVVLGLPTATFSFKEKSDEFNLSALPEEEKQKILEVDTSVQKLDDKAKKLDSPSSENILTKNSSLTVRSKRRSLTLLKEQKKKKLLMKKSLKHLHKHTLKKNLKFAHKNLTKSKFKYSYQQLRKGLKRSVRQPPKVIPRVAAKCKKIRCKECKGCLKSDCGKCVHCLDKKKFGGPNTIKQACIHRRCLNPILPISEIRITKLAAEDKCNRKSSDQSLPSGSTSSRPFSPLSCASPISSPDASSCSSSCSSSSSSSSSGSNDSSSSSNNGSGSEGRGSGNNSSSHFPSLGNNCSSNSTFKDSVTEAVLRSLQDTSYKDDEPVLGNTFLEHNSVLEMNDNELDFMNSESPTDAVNDDSVTSSSNNSFKKQNSKQSSSGRSFAQEIQKESNDFGENNSDDEDDDGNKRKNHFIKADCWDMNSSEKKCNQGYALISTELLPLQAACFLCGSAGEEQMIYCVVCCEPFHPFCLNKEDVPHPENVENWCCNRCQSCAVCGIKNNLLKCNKCQDTYHPECLSPHYPTKPSKRKKIWVCPKCVKCKSCGTTAPNVGSGVLWNFDLLLCQNCTKLTDKGNFCPICHKCYEDDDYESQMVECANCDSWVHAKCDRISDETYEILSCLPETVVYTCFNCTKESPPIWKMAVKNALQSGLKTILNALLYARCTRHLALKKVEDTSLFVKNQVETSQTLVNSLSLSRAIETSLKNLVESTFATDILKSVTTTETHTSNNLSVHEVISSESSKTDIVNMQNQQHVSDFESKSQMCQGLTENEKKNLNEININKSENPLPDANSSSSATQESTAVDDKKSLFDVGNSDHKNDNSLILKSFMSNPYKKDPLDLLTVKKKLDNNKYETVKEFFDEVVEVINSGDFDGKKGYVHIARSMFAKQIEKVFPWFQISEAKLWKSEQNSLPNDLLPQAVVPPSSDHIYAQYLVKEKKNETSQPSCLRHYEGKPVSDIRQCVLCRMKGDDYSKKCGRLLYCGQDDWIHVNCAVWSAEVLQERDGALLNVFPAISRGKLMKCEFCREYGATVGCCVRGCPANYHFFCARAAAAVFLEDRRLFCFVHKDNADKPLVKDDEFSVNQYVFVSQEGVYPKWVKESWKTGFKTKNLHILVGSLTIESLGYLTRSSDNADFLVPINFQCKRLFWSTKNPKQRVIYSCRAIEITPKSSPCVSTIVENQTIAHDLDVPVWKTPSKHQSVNETIECSSNVKPLINEKNVSVKSSKEILQNNFLNSPVTHSYSVNQKCVTVEKIPKFSTTVCATKSVFPSNMQTIDVNKKHLKNEQNTIKNNDQCDFKIKQDKDDEILKSISYSALRNSNNNDIISNVETTKSKENWQQKLQSYSYINNFLNPDSLHNEKCMKNKSCFSSEINSCVGKQRSCSKELSNEYFSKNSSMSIFKNSLKRDEVTQTVNSKSSSHGYCNNILPKNNVNVSGLKLNSTLKVADSDLLHKNNHLNCNISKNNDSLLNEFLERVENFIFNQTKDNSQHSKNREIYKRTSKIIVNNILNKLSECGFCQSKALDCNDNFLLHSVSENKIVTAGKHVNPATLEEQRKRKLTENSIYEKGKPVVFSVLHTSLKEEKQKLKSLLKTCPSESQYYQETLKFIKIISKTEILKFLNDCILQRKINKLASNSNGYLWDKLLPVQPITETVLPVYDVKQCSQMNGDESSNNENKSEKLRKASAHHSDFYSQLNSVNNEKLVFNSCKKCQCDLPFSELHTCDKIFQNGIHSSVNSKQTKINGYNTLNCNEFKYSETLNTKSDSVSKHSKVINEVKTKVDCNGFVNKTQPYSFFTANKVAMNGNVESSPVKCDKCKRVYRTKESFEKHIESCNFIIDSSSTDEDEEEETNKTVYEACRTTAEENSLIKTNVAVLNDFSKTGLLVGSDAGQSSGSLSLPEINSRSLPAENHAIQNDGNYNIQASLNNNACSQENRKHLEPEMHCKTNLEINSDNPTDRLKNSVFPNKSTSNSLCSQTYSNSIINNSSTTSSKKSSKSPAVKSSAVKYSNHTSLKKISKSHSIIPSVSSYRKNYSQRSASEFRYQSTKLIRPKITSSMPSTQNNSSEFSSNNFKQVILEPCTTIDVNTVPLVTHNFNETANVNYSGNIYSAPEVFQVPSGTYFIPTKSELISPSLQSFNQVQAFASSYAQVVQPPVDLSQTSNLPYVGTVTITNSETMSFSVNVQNQIVPGVNLYPSQIVQQSIPFEQTSLLPSPVHLQTDGSFQFSGLNIQVPVQNSYQTNLGSVVFPQHTNLQNQLVYISESASHSQIDATSEPPNNLLLQIPVGFEQQQQQCVYQAVVNVGNHFQELPVVPEPKVNQYACQMVSENQMQQLPDSQNCVQQVSEEVDSSPIVQDELNSSLTEYSVKDFTYSKYDITNSQSIKETHTPDVANSTNDITEITKTLDTNESSMSSVVDAFKQSENNSASSVSFPGSDGYEKKTEIDDKIVNLLKKAATQMLNIKTYSKKASVTSISNKDTPVEVPEKKTRFAHTRKVAARKAQQLKNKQMKNNPLLQSHLNNVKNECFKLNIASGVPSITFSIPVSKIQMQEGDLNKNRLKPLEDVRSEKESKNCLSAVFVTSKIDPYVLEAENDENESVLLALHEREERRKERKETDIPKDKPYIMYEISSDDGFCIQTSNIHDAWKALYDKFQDARIASHMPQVTISPDDIDGVQMMGLNHPSVRYLLEQLQGVEKCTKYNFSYHQPSETEKELIENLSGCARTEIYLNRREYDMFNFLASEHRKRPIYYPPDEEEEGAPKSTRRAANADLPIAMRFRNLKTIARETVGVYRSNIHGRGLFCKRNIDPGELVIEYAGEVIRSVLTDKREHIYQSKGIGCYMFRIDDDEVVDATMHGNAARFINHSCEPNCFSKVITVDGKKHIVIFALRRIMKGEELTYDYKFPFEEEKIPCSCNSRRCRKYLN